ncbi:MAG: hypothetical protein NDJ89_12800 [Oligoflexia bacterium]|nr:hypothetical protein [Oligoflexia bacterium]
MKAKRWWWRFRRRRSAEPGLISGNPPTGSHAWSASWDRPMKLDEKSIDPLTVARMTDHNVRGEDDGRDKRPEPSVVRKKA